MHARFRQAAGKRFERLVSNAHRSTFRMVNVNRQPVQIARPRFRLRHSPVRYGILPRRYLDRRRIRVNVYMIGNACLHDLISYPGVRRRRPNPSIQTDGSVEIVDVVGELPHPLLDNRRNRAFRRTI
jgi:hypothetical protein